MPDQDTVAQDLIQYLNRTGHQWAIVARPDQADRTRPRWDYTLKDAGTEECLALEVTSSRRTEDAGLVDATWSRVILDEVKTLVQAAISGNFLVSTPERIEATAVTRSAVISNISSLIIRLCQSGLQRCADLANTPHGDVRISINRGACPAGDVGFIRIPEQESYEQSSAQELERILLNKNDQLEAILQERLVPYIIIWNENAALVDPTDLARSAYQIIRRNSLQWRGAYIWGCGQIIAINPAAPNEVEAVTWDRT